MNDRTTHTGAAVTAATSKRTRAPRHKPHRDPDAPATREQITDPDYPTIHDLVHGNRRDTAHATYGQLVDHMTGRFNDTEPF